MQPTPEHPQLTDAEKLAYITQKLAITVSEIRTVTGQEWDVSLHLFKSERYPGMADAASAVGMVRAEHESRNRSNWNSYDQQFDYGSITLYDYADYNSLTPESNTELRQAVTAASEISTEEFLARR